MQLLRLTLAVIISTTLFTACKKDEKKDDTYTCTTCKSTPDALAANDNTSKGVYKGTLIGSSGTIMFNIMNGVSNISAILTVDGISATLTSTATWVSGQPFLATFTGTWNNQPTSLTFAVAADGTNPTITAYTIYGHPTVSFYLYKELSTAQVRVFEGTYSNTLPETGTFNLVISGSTWSALGRKDNSTSTSTAGGAFVNNQLIGGNPIVTMGTVNGDVVTGTFLNNNGNTVTINGHRTL
ncbi:MAG: hypothetical protein C4330_05495 [Chitinophagaceae bacterium]